MKTVRPAHQMKRLLPFAIITIVLGAGVALGLYLRHSAESGQAMSFSGSSKPGASRLSGMPMPGAEPAHTRGSANASVTLEEFADFQCPACGKLYPMLKSIEREYGDRVRVIFREFPLNQHQHAIAAGRVAEAAGLQGKFWEMHDLLYENRDAWSKAVDVQPIFGDYARQLGLDLEKFDRDQTGKIVETRISEDHLRGRSLRIRATPTLYLNGAEIPYAQWKTIEGLRTVVKKALNP
jgi:protein-disulfide isomerase